MILISHRGNLNGPNKDFENSPEYIYNALSKGFNVEVDVNVYKNKIFLGHDEPQYKINSTFLLNKKIWCHAKDILALERLKKIKAIYYWHQNDEYTITSNGYFWTYPGRKLVKNSICVMPEVANYKNIYCAGICSDFITKYKKND
jgi:hypothetical protein